MGQNLEKKIIIFGKGPAAKVALKSAKKLLNKSWTVYYFYFKNENDQYDNLKICKNLKIKYELISSYNCFSEKIFFIKPNFILLIQCSLIIKSDIISFMGENIINLHHGNLPKYRGMAPITNAILNREKSFGITIHFIEERIDAGKIIDQIIFNIEGLNNEEVYKKCIASDEEAISNLLKKINISQKLDKINQNEVEATYYPKTAINYESPIIDFNQISYSVISFCKAYYFPSKNLFPLINFNNNLYYSTKEPKLGFKAIKPNIFKFNKEERKLSISCKDRWILFENIKLKN